MCLGCLGAGAVAGWIGSYIGIPLPKPLSGKILVGLGAASLTALTVVALKFFANIALCQGAGTSLLGMSLTFIKMLPIGVIYALAIASLLNRFVYPPPCTPPPSCIPPPSCCQKGK